MIRLVLLFMMATISTSSWSKSSNACDQLNFPINFDQYGLPYVGLAINGEIFRAHVDLGSSHAIHLPTSMISKIGNIQATGKSIESSNIAGKKFIAKQYAISSLPVGCMRFDNLIALELNDWGTPLGDNKKHVNTEDIIIGAGFFQNKIVEIDYQQHLLSVYTTTDKSLPAPPSHTTMNFKQSIHGISIPMNSGLKYYQMVLDTGASSSIFSASRISDKETISSCNYNMGDNIKCQYLHTLLMAGRYPFKSKIFIYPIDPRFEYDGILGRDFFERFKVTLNFIDQGIQLTPYR